MTRGALGLVLAATAVFAGACERAPAPATEAGGTPAVAREVPEEARRRAEAAADRLMGRLLGELKAALAAGPPEDAVRVCADVAQEVTADVAREQGVRVGRTSLRVRNPKNAPDAWERAAMERWAAGAAEMLPIVEVRGGEVRYLRPIVMPALCVACHGPPDSIAPAVRAAIRDRYPGDEATGFQPGDLRGAVSVRFSLDEPNR